MNQVNIWIPLISSVVGGMLVLFGQRIDRRSRNKIENKKNLLEIYAFCRKLEALMKSNYRELAATKTQAEYWYHCSETAVEKKDIYYQEYLKSVSHGISIERRIGETKADFISQAYKFQTIKEIPIEVEKALVSISDLPSIKSKHYGRQPDNKLMDSNIVKQDEEELREKYYSQLTHFKLVNDSLKGLIR